ncbi:MAG: FHA domain-containing protein [Candidatus Thiodiazotropha taylori]
MPNLVRCPEGLHQYDAERYSICPYCNSQQTRGGGTNSSVATRIVDRPGASSPDEDKTTRPMRPPPEAPQKSANSETTKILRTDSGHKPVTGWLVVIDGIGKGASLPIHHGVNSIGRDSSQSICLTFSGQQDAEIAREGQARITYDPKNNLFFLQHGEGTNLTYLNDMPVLELKNLEAYDRISMGKSQFLFVPFCNDRFQWPED